MRYLAFLACFLAAGSGASLQIKTGTDATRPEVVAKIAMDLPKGEVEQERGEKLLPFALVDEKTGKEGPPILGDYEHLKGELTFRPRHPLITGQLYRARLLTDPKQKVTAEYRVPAKKAGPPSEVKSVLPALDVLPANNLRFTIHFSKPMRGGKEIFQQIRILDAEGKEVYDPWLHDELWGDDDCRLLLYIHPGRIKWGVLLRMLFGPVLLPDREYTLVISPDLLDADGQRLGKEYRKKFRTTAEDRVRIELKDWKLRAPEAGTKQPLTVDFPKAMHHTSLNAYLAVCDSQGKRLEGTMTVGKEQKSWTFTPSQPWGKEEYRLTVDENLEDLAGNTPMRPFDVDLTARPPARQELMLTFRPAAKP